MPKMLNGIEVPTKGRIVWVRSQEEQGYREYPAIVIDAVDPTALIDVHFFSRSGDYPGFNTPHESEPGLSDGALRWRWPPREEQAPTAVTAPDESPTLEERVRQLEALIDEEPGANDKQKERLQRQLALRNENEKDLRSAHAKLEARLLDARKELDKARLAEAAAMAAGKTACDAMRAERDELEGKNILNKNALRLAREDARCAMRLAGQVTLNTQSAEEAMVAVLKLLEEARRLAYDLATYGSPLCPASSSHDREWIAKEWNERRAAALLFGAPAPKAGE